MANNSLEVSLALKASGFKSEINNIKKENQLLRAEFDKLSNSVDDFEETLDGKKAKLKLVSNEYENARKTVDIYRKKVEESKDAVEKANAELKRQQSVIDATRAYIEKYKDETGEVANAVKEAESRLEELEEEFQKQAKAVVSANNQYQNMQIALARAEIDVVSLEKELKNMATELYQVENNTDDAKKSLLEFSVTVDDVVVSVKGSSVSLKDLSNNLKSTGSAITNAGKTVSVASGIVTGLGTASVVTAMSFEQSMANVSATMGITAEEIANGSESFNKLKESALESAKTTEFSASQSAEALNYLALAGYDVEKAIETLPKVLTLASAGGLDLAYASDLLTDSMSALQLEVDEVDSFIDSMSKTAQSSNTSVAQLGEAFLTVGGTANTLVGGVNEASTAIGILSDNGIKGSEAGTALRNIILSLTSPTNTATKEMKKLGVEIQDSSGEMRPLVDIFGDFNKELEGLTEADKNSALYGIFNKTDLAAVKALMASVTTETSDLNKALTDMGIDSEKNASKIETLKQSFVDGKDKTEIMKDAVEELGISTEQASDVYDVLSKSVGGSTSRFEELNKKISESEGSANSMAETMSSTTSGSFQELSSKLEVLAIGFGDLLLPIVDEFVNMLGNLIDWFSSLSEHSKKVILAIGGIVAVAGPLLVIVGTLISSLGTIIGVFTSVATAITNAGGVMAFFSASVLPVIAVIGGLIGIAFILYQSIKANFDGIKEATNNLLETCRPYFEQLRQAFSELWRVCQEIYSTIIQPLFDMIGKVIEICINFATPFFIIFAQLFTDAINIIVSIWDNIGKPLFEAIMFIVQAVFDFVSPIFNLIAEVFSAMVEAIMLVFNNVLKPIFDLFMDTVGALFDKVSPAFEGIRDSIVNALKTVNDAIDGAIGWIRSLMDSIGNALGKVGEFMSSLNPFKSKSIDVDATMRANIPGMASIDAQINPIGEVALSGSYYTRNTPLSEGMAKLGSVASGLNSTNSTSAIYNQDTTKIESILETYLGQFVQAISSFNPTIEVGLNGRKLSEELNIINGQGMKLNERWR